MEGTDFFDKRSEQSSLKTSIVLKYFLAWARIIRSQQKKRRREDRIAFFDLFCGPGRYKDGTPSTPLRLLEAAVKEPALRGSLVSIFNDKIGRHTELLKAEISEIPEIDSLRYPPVVLNHEVDEALAAALQRIQLVPALFFLDPWGYKGLSLDLLNAALKDWGSECIFFFNYNRINMSLNNPIVRQSMNALFGERRAEVLRKSISGLSPVDRETAIVDEIRLALEQEGKDKVRPFCFKTSRSHRTSHYLIFVSKHPLGYKIMKDIMAKSSSETEQGVPTFEYAPVEAKQQTLFDETHPLDDLVEMLLNDFAGRTISAKELFEQHHVGKRFVAANYKEALKRLEQENKIRTSPPAQERKSNTLGDRVVISFPPKKV